MIQTSRRMFIAALLGGAIALDELQAIPQTVEQVEDFGPWVQLYSYPYFAQLRDQIEVPLSLDVDRNFWLDGIVWNAPEGTRFKVVAGSASLDCVLPFYGLQHWPVMPSVAVPAGTKLTVRLQNLRENWGRHDVWLELQGRREMTKEEIMQQGAIDADFEDESEYEGPDE